MSAQYALGELYASGQGVPQDYAKTRQWWERAAAQGHAEAQNSLGLMYAQGQVVPEDDVKARQWFEQAAAQGHAKAQFVLGLIYAKGLGAPKDDMRAYMWSSLAAVSTGDQQTHAIEYRDKVASRMTPTQLAEAQRLAHQCQAQQFKGC